MNSDFFSPCVVKIQQKRSVVEIGNKECSMTFPKKDQRVHNNTSWTFLKMGDQMKTIWFCKDLLRLLITCCCISVALKLLLKLMGYSGLGGSSSLLCDQFFNVLWVWRSSNPTYLVHCEKQRSSSHLNFAVNRENELSNLSGIIHFSFWKTTINPNNLWAMQHGCEQLRQ